MISVHVPHCQDVRPPPAAALELLLAPLLPLLALTLVVMGARSSPTPRNSADKPVEPPLLAGKGAAAADNPLLLLLPLLLARTAGFLNAIPAWCPA